MSAVPDPGLIGAWDDDRTVDDLDASIQGRAAGAANGSSEQPTRWARIGAEITRITLHFPPSWFSVNMGTGITAVLLHEFPYQARWLYYLSCIIFAFDLLLFGLFTLISIMRYVRWPALLRVLLRHPSQSMFIGAYSMALSTIVNLCTMILVPAWGHSFLMFTWALWWLNAAMAIVMSIALPTLQFTRHSHTLETVTGVLLLPIVTLVVGAATGATVAEQLAPAHARLTLIVSYMMWGSGFLSALMCITLFYARLIIHKIPPAALIVTIFLPLGPFGQGSFGLLKMSSVINKLSLETGQALVGLSQASAEEARTMALAIYGGTIPVALCIWGFGLVWLVIAISLLVDLLLVSKLQFNLGWWGFTFPLGTFCTATLQLAKEFDSGGFRVLGAALSVAEILLWFAIGSMTAYRAVRGEIFFSPCLAELGGVPPNQVLMVRQYEYQPRTSHSSSSKESKAHTLPT